MAEFRELVNRDESHGRRRRQISAAKACADDVGAVVAEIKQLKQLKQVFDHSRELAHLKLKSSKCHIVPLSGPFDEFRAQ
eukprot:821924-Pyramimonas_sp.AAC.1